MLSDCLGETLSEPETNQLKKLISELKLQREKNKSNDDDMSDLSEDDDNLYPDEENEKDMKLIQLELKPTTNPRIKKLFSNTDKLIHTYSFIVGVCMTRERGKALIINNKNFVERSDLYREGSDADVENMSVMLKSLKFDVETHTDLTAEVYYS
ncbi:hypothetical protein EB796_015644 [Bugula neritina]|uniref:Caspase family p20 domain-containing protein n=1 Tax=Bugula neritina TaxID=10212 RepID=A0A7J7JJ11_BUGNE|nr:hypothetical protein EB796_015644 [Bugula neritina]